jgi:hypothetical protein
MFVIWVWNKNKSLKKIYPTVFLPSNAVNKNVEKTRGQIIHEKAENYGVLIGAGNAAEYRSGSIISRDGRG